MTHKNNGLEISKVNIPTTLQYLLLFLLLTFLCYEVHETFHHVVAAVLCGGFGTMTLTVYEPQPQCQMESLVTLAGPALSFGIAWTGGYLLLKNKHVLFAYTLIFASFAHLRFPLPLMGSGDEWSVVRRQVYEPNPYFYAALLFLLALPPLVTAFRSIANQRRIPVFAASWLMPFLVLFGLPIVDGWLFGPDLQEVNRSVMGVPVIVLVMDLAASMLFVWIGRRFFRQHKVADAYNQQVSIA